MNSVYLEILVIIILLMANGALAAAEIALVSSKRISLQRLYNNGDERALAALDLMDNPNKLFSTIQIGITSIGIVSGAFGGATLAVKLSQYLSQSSTIAPYSSVIGYGSVVLIISYMTLIIGELVPKRLAYADPEAISIYMAKTLSLLARLVSPFVKILSVSTELVVRLFGIKSYQSPDVSEEEIRIMIKQGAESGIFEEVEHELVERVLRLDDRNITSIMTPTRNMVAINIHDDPSVNLKKVTETNFTRYPVLDGSFDRILGVVHVKELLRGCLSGEPFDPARKLENIMVLEDTCQILDGLMKFKESKESVSAVVDADGRILGFVTLTDLVKSILGKIGALELVSPQYAIQRADGSWLVEGSAPVDKLKDIMKVPVLPGEERMHYTTSAGFVMYFLDGIPQEGDSFEWEQWRFEIIDMDGFRIDKILLHRIHGM